MSHKPVNAIPTAVHAMRPTENKELTHRELDTSASMEISVLLKILNSTNSAMLKKPPVERHTNSLNAFLATKDPKISVTSVLKVSMCAQVTEQALVQVLQEPYDHE